MEWTEGIVIAAIGLAGVLAGSLITLASQLLTHCLKQRAERAKDNPRRKLLKAMLKDSRFEWRRLDTLAHVIGADYETTKRLLLEIEARASENGEDLWALISDKPLPGSQ